VVMPNKVAQIEAGAGAGTEEGRKPLVRRNQDRVLRAAGDLFPRRGGLIRVRGNSHVRF